MVIALLGAVGATLAGCSSGGSDPAPGGGTSHTLSGTAAAGAPIVGIVNVKGANGATASAPIDANGHFSLDVSALTASYILYAEGRVNGTTVRIYSAAVAEGQINITPFTDLIVANTMRTTLQSAYDNWVTTHAGDADITTAKENLKAAILPVLTATNAQSIDLMTGAFNADNTGLDAALDVLGITYVGTTATIVNKITGSTTTDNITISGPITPLPASDNTDTLTGLTDLEGINILWGKVITLFSGATKPTLSQAETAIGPYIATDAFHDGQNRDQYLSDFVSDGPDSTCSKIAAVIDHPMTTSELSSTSYLKGYWVTVNYKCGPDVGSMVDSMVYNSSSAKWQEYGNREWLGFDLQAEAHKSIPPTGPATMRTGFSFWLDDNYNYAYNQGVNSAIVTGPGLPVGGVVMDHKFPQTWFSVTSQTNGSGGSHYYIADDSALGSIPDNAVYTVKLYAESAATVTTANTSLRTITDYSPKRPYLNSELSAALWPTLTSPTSHSITAANIPGILNISWTNPAGAAINHADLNWWDGVKSNQVQTKPATGATSLQIDTSTFGAASSWASLWMSGTDSANRQISMDWQFN